MKPRSTTLRAVSSVSPPAPRRVPRIAVVIPVFNEEKNIESVLGELAQLRRARPRWEIVPVFVNDGSTDRTATVLDALAPLFQARVITLPLNLGIGRAVQTGFQWAVRWGADVTLQLDGDGQHPALEIPKIVCPVLAQATDVAVGSRYVSGAGGMVSSRLRRIGTAFFSVLLRVVAGVRVADTTSGFRAFSPEATDFLAKRYPDDYPEVQTYVPLARSGFSIREVAVTMRYRAGGSSSITPIRSLYYMLKVAFATLIDRVRPLPARLPKRKKR
jgi:glycosyltransferase involved in cell wall biosynthesis